MAFKTIKFGLAVLSKQRQFKARERWTRQQFHEYQSNELHGLRHFAYANSPFYKEFHKGHYDAPLHELPVLTKTAMMEHFDNLVTDKDVHLQDIKAYIADPHRTALFLGRFTINVTAGTSGRTGVVVFSSDEWATCMASAFTYTPMHLSLTHRSKLAQVASTTAFHMSAMGGATLRSLLMPGLILAASEPLATMVDKLNNWKPRVLVVYASIGRILADEQIAGRLHITPRTVLCGSEPLTEETRRRMAQAWGGRIFNNYAATECGAIAVECGQHRGMHVVEDLVIVENVDSDNKPVPDGVYGDKLLVTSLFKRAQPVIRYEIEDSVRFAKEACPCGRPTRLIDSIQGRMQDVLSFPAKAGGRVSVHPLVFHSIIDVLPVSGWQVVQEVDGLHILLSGVHGGVDDEQLKNLMEKALASQGALVPPVTVQRVMAIPQTMAGKTPLVKSNLPHTSRQEMR
jgi:putative adenylate-forming enzyme